MLRRSTGFQVFPLTSGGNNQPNLTQGGATNFDFAAIQISMGKLPYYLLGIVVTLYGTVTQSGGTGVAIPPDTLTGILLQSIEVRNTWMGTPLSQQFVLGQYLPLIEYLGCGYRLPRRESLPIPAANGSVNFARTIVLPLCIGMYNTPHHTAALAAMYKTAQLVLNIRQNGGGDSNALATLSPGATMSNLTAQASVILDPHPSLLLGCGQYWVDYQTTAAGTQQSIQLNAFGNSPTIKGSEVNDGVIALYAIGNGAVTGVGAQMPLPGSFNPGVVNSYEFPWRAQFRTTHPEAIAAAQFLAMGGNGKQVWNGDSTTFNSFDSQGFPYENNDTLAVSPPGAGPTRPILQGMYGFPLVIPTEDLSLATVQTAQNAQSYFLGLATGSFSGVNHTLGWHCSSWTQNARDNWVTTVVNSGLAGLVLGTTNVKLVQQDIGGKKASRFQPWALQAA